MKTVLSNTLVGVLLHSSGINAMLYSARLSSHRATSSSVTLEGKRTPSSHSPAPAICASSFALSPRSDAKDVQKGITFLPVKSLARMNVLTGHAASCHQMG